MRKLLWFLHRRRRESDLQDELRFHLEEEAHARELSGAAPDEARFAAIRDLGNVALVQEDTRAAWGWILVEQFFQDVRYAFRAMGRNRSFTALAVLSLALGIGANTAIFSFMDAILVRTLPVADPASLVVVNWRLPRKISSRQTPIHAVSGSSYDDATSTNSGIFPYPVYELLRDSPTIFSSVFAYYPMRQVTMIAEGHAEVIKGEFVSGGFFRTLGVVPAAGRFIEDSDDREDAPPAAVLSFTAARSRFGDAASAIGRPVVVNNHTFTVVGVAPREFFGIDPAYRSDLYVAFHANILLAPAKQMKEVRESYQEKNYYWVEMMGRLQPGVTLAQAQAALAPRFREWVAATAEGDQERSHLPALSLRDGVHGLETLRYRFSEPLYVLLAMVGLILAIACANVANLLLTRATARRREMAVRLSIGAGRSRVIRQLLTESVMLASLGGVAGVLFAMWGSRVLAMLLARSRQGFPLEVGLNWHVLAAAAALSIFTGIVFGLAPALQATKVDILPALKEGATVTIFTRIRSFRLRVGLSQVLVVAQIAVSLLLLVAAGLFVRTLNNLQAINLGFNRDNLLLFTLDARQAGHKDPEITTFYADLDKRFAAIPGVRSTTVSIWPIIGDGTWQSDVAPIGMEQKVNTHILSATAGLFDTMKIPIIAGRAFDGRDKFGAPGVAIVNETWAQVYYPGASPLGHQIIFHDKRRLKPTPLEIVGVARNARYGDLTGEYPSVVYLPFIQANYYPPDEMYYALRTNGNPLQYGNAVRRIVQQTDSRIPVTNMTTESAQVDQIMNQEMIFARLCTAFAILALVIACIGLYGTMAYTVARRTSEFGIRMALGARIRHIMAMVMRQVVVMSAAGLIAGIVIARNIAGLVKSFLYDVKPDDPTTLWVAGIALTVAALAAGYIPARHAARIDPSAALK
jgi:predicted permease